MAERVDGGEVERARSEIEALRAEVARLEREVAERERAASTAMTLAELGRELVGTLEPAEAADRIVSAVLGLLAARRAVLFQLDAGSGALTCVAAAGGESAAAWLGTVLRPGESMASHAIAGGRPVWSPDPLADPELLMPAWAAELFRADGCLPAAAAPLLCRGKARGALCVCDVEGRVFTDEDLVILGVFADQAALALESARLRETLEARASGLATLARLNHLVSASLDMEKLLGAIARTAATLMRVPFVSFWVVDEAAETVTLRACSDEEIGRPILRMTLPFGEGLTGWVAAHRQPVNLPDVLADPRTRVRDWWRGSGLRSEIIVPIILDDAVLAVLCLHGREPFDLGQDDQDLFDNFVAQAAIAIRNGGLYDEARRQGREAEAMAELVRDVSASLDLDEVLLRVAAFARDLCGSDVARVALREPGSNAVVLRYRHWVGARATSYDTIRIEPGQGSGGVVLLSGRPFRTDNYLADPRISRVFAPIAHAEGHVAEMVVPIRGEERIEGLLYVSNRTRRPFTDRDEAVLLWLADYAAIAMRNAQLFAREQAARADAEASGQRFRDLIESVDAVVWEAEAPPPGALGEWVSPRRFTFVSRHAEGLFGYPVERWMADPDFWVTLIHAEDRVATLEACRRGLREARGGEMEYRAVAADGRVVWLRDIVRVVLDEEGRVVRRRGVMVAVTAARAAADALRESEERFRCVFEDAAVGIALVAPDGTWLGVNREMCHLTGYAEGELLGRRFQELSHPDDLGAQLVARDRTLAGEIDSYQLEKRYVHKRGHVIWVRLSSSAVRSTQGEALYTIAVIQDVTARRWAERRQASQVTVTHALADAARLPEVVPGLLRAICEGVGWELGEIWRVDPDANVLRWEGMWHVPDLPVGDFGGTSREMELPAGAGLPGLVWASGRARWMINVVADSLFLRGLLAAAVGLHTALAFPIRTPSEMMGVMVFFSRDVYEPDPDLLAMMEDIGAQIAQFVERKRVEEALRQSQERLRQAERIEAIGRLAGGIAHDFNNLLTVLGSRTEILLESLSPDDPRWREVELIQKTVERAATLTRQLLAFSRKQVLQPTVLDMNAVVEGVGGLLRRLIGEHIVVETARDADLGRVRADRGQIEQVIVNLVVNARDAMTGGGRLRLETANARLDDEFVRQHPGASEGDFVVLAVHDTGIGMDEATRGRVFEPFFTTKEPGQGTGLGLASVYGIVKQHEGYISLESEPGRGSVFRVYLPRVEDAPAAAVAATSPAVRPRGMETILVVEDDPDVLDLTAEILRGRAYSVLTARHGAEALRVCAAHPGPIHLLLTDVVMPHVSGPELARLVIAARPETRILYMSGYVNDAPIASRGLLDSSTCFLHKPYTLETLAAKVRETLDQPRRE